MRCHRVSIALLLLAASPAAWPAEGEATAFTPGQPQTVPPPKGRILNGHVFMPAADVPGALPTTSFVADMVLALGTASAPNPITIGNTTLSGDFQYAGVGNVVGYEYAFLDYFSARLIINDIIFSGINGGSVLAVGTQVRVGFTGGLTASLPIGDSLRVALLFDAGKVPAMALTIGNGIRQIVNSCNAGSCNVNASDVFALENATTIQPAVAASWAPMPALGVTANVAYIHQSQDQNSGQSLSADAMSLGLATDFDFRAISTVPVGLMLQFNWTAPVNGQGLQHVTDIGGGVFYTGRQNLALGIQLISRRFQVTPDVKVSWGSYISTIGLRYYW